MKKFKIILAFIGIAALFMTSCDDDSTADVSSITNYPVFDMSGDQVIFHTLGDPFTDPGVTASEGGTDITVTSTVAGTYSGFSGATVDVNTADEYVITYSAENSDGFSGSVNRYVYVNETGDLATSIAGVYVCDVVREDPPEAHSGIQYVMIWETSTPGTYEITHALGGFYAVARGYGDNYRGQGATITVNDISTNDFSYTDGVVPGWGLPVVLYGMTVDAANKEIKLKADFVSGTYIFDITLKQVQF